MSIFPVGGGGLTLIEHFLLTGAVSEVTFSNIPELYNHLRVEYTARFTDASEIVYGDLQINDLTTSIYYGYTTLYHYNSAWDDAEARADSKLHFGRICAATAQADYASGGFYVFSNPRAGAFYKSFYGESQVFGQRTSTNLYLRLFGGVIETLNAISKIRMYSAGGGNFVAGSEVSLYGMG